MLWTRFILALALLFVGLWLTMRYFNEGHQLSDGAIGGLAIGCCIALVVEGVKRSRRKA